MLMDMLFWAGVYIAVGMTIGVAYTFFTGENDTESGVKVVFLWPVIIAVIIAAWISTGSMFAGMWMRKLVKK